MYERQIEIRNRIIAIIVLTATVLSLCACAKDGSLFKNGYTESERAILNNGFSAHFIDVGEGDCSVIKFPDGKILMIDAGSDNEKIYKKIKSVLNELAVQKIDYLVLSHPDTEHVGNAGRLISDFTVGTVYMPNIKEENREYFPEFSAVYQRENAFTTVNPKLYDYIAGESYFFAFLSPDFHGDYYAALNTGENITEEIKDDVSPIIYLEYAGVRFILSSDARATAEQRIVEDYASTAYKNIFGMRGITIDLEDVDFYKTASHGDNKSNSEEFLNLLKPKRAVISVGGGNYKGHPSFAVLNRLLSVREGCELYRTDYFGTVSVLVDGNGEITLKKERRYV